MGAFFKFKEKFGYGERFKDGMKTIYGLGKSENEETYIDQYISYTNDLL